MIVKRAVLPVLVLLIGLSGCMKKKKPAVDHNKKRVTTVSQIDMPLAGDLARLDEDETIRSFFDQDMEEFVSLAQEEGGDDTLSLAQAVDAEAKDISKAGSMDEFSWIEASEKDEQFNVVYFDFNEHSVRQDQEERVIQDIEQTKQVLADNNNKPTIVIEGHACHSAGSAVYNLALSERRAKAIADWFISAGVPQENIKIVGRGFEVPAIISGKPVEGTREEQWPNRRVEVHLIYT